MTKKIYMVRHANAEEQQRGERDFDRPLSRAGYRNAAHVGVYFSSKGIVPDLFLSSPAVRAYQTAEILADLIKFNTVGIVQDEEIYEGSARVLLRIINALKPEANTVVLIAHNPGITFIAEYLTGGQIGNMQPAGIAEIAFDGLEWAEVSQNTGKLVQYIGPEELG